MKVTIALPVLNEEMMLRRSVERLLDFVREHMPEAECTIVISDNGSDDRTEEIGRKLAAQNCDVKYVRTAERGKGLAILTGWQAVAADVYAFMDIDLSTDLVAFPELCNVANESGGVAVGSRFHKDSVVVRSLVRRVYSRGYRTLIRLLFGKSVADAPCGFKAISREVFQKVIPHVSDRRWFFDTELVIRSERAGYKIHEIPVIWQEKTLAGRRSRVNAPRLAVEYLVKVLQLRTKLR